MKGFSTGANMRVMEHDDGDDGKDEGIYPYSSPLTANKRKPILVLFMSADIETLSSCDLRRLSYFSLHF